MAVLNSARVGIGRRAALLVIDATRGFTDPASPLGIDASFAVGNIGRLLHAFRKARAPVFFTVNAYASPDEATVFRRKLPALNELKANGPWAEIDERVAPQPGESILRKTVPSAFFDSPLRTMLRGQGIDTVVVCGFSTSGCVRATAVDALQCNLRVVVVADACDDRDRAAHDYNLRDLVLKIGDVVDTPVALAMLEAAAARNADGVNEQ